MTSRFARQPRRMRDADLALLRSGLSDALAGGAAASRYSREIS